MERKLICLDKDNIDDINFYLRTSDYTDENFNCDYGMNVKKKNNIYIPSNLVKKINYRYFNYISTDKLEASFFLKLLMDLYKTIGENQSLEREKTYESILKVEDILLSFDKVNISKINYSEINKNDFINLPVRMLGIIDAANIYADNVVLHAARGHGFAAEKANHLWDKITGKDATIVGGDNIKNGADRFVNGVYIQTKYCSSGSKCINQCFENDKFRYMGPDGTPMQIEVPSDMYESAIKSMEDKIIKGKVPGVTDPKEAKNIVRKGNITYTQARNIAKFGTIESLTYDVANGIKLAGTTAGLSAIVAFSCSLWNGDDWKKALENSCYTGLKVGGTAWASSIISSQVGRTGVEQSLRGTTDWVVRNLGYKTSAIIANAIRSGSDIYGAAAANYLSKVLRGNVVTGIVTTTVLSSVDVYQLFKGRISGAQALKNVTVTATSVAGGTGGWMAGAAAGAALGSAVPIIGTAAGGIVGGLIGSFGGGWAANKITKSTMDLMIKDDADEMIELIQIQFGEIAFDYMLSKEEAEWAIGEISNKIDTKLLMDIYSSENRSKHAYEWMEPLAQEKLSKRKAITKTPTENEIIEETKVIIINGLESSSDSNIINLKYEGAESFTLNEEDRGIDLTGTIIPSNYHCPIYKNINFGIYSPSDCLIIKHHKTTIIENGKLVFTALVI
ncbi:hypothetical protein ABRP72_05730 [Pectobacterium carotovorum]|uniref:hypothetical protein n=1 Tax=Pectobacterium carotovorum TaxID=554 RepID=UPI0032EDD733